MKRSISCLVFLLMLALAVLPAQADGNCPIGCSLCTCFRSCSSCRRCKALMQTARPAATAAPRCACPTPAPCARQQTRTAAPVAQATSRPTAQATFRPITQPSAAPTAQPAAGTGDYTTISLTAQEQKLWNLLNQDRAANGLSALPLDEELCRIARVKSCDMRDNGYFAHESPTYGNAAAMLTGFGYAYSGVGENIAHHATVEKADAAFLSSAGHRTNMMGSQWKKVGIGVCLDKNGFVYVTELFVR